MILVGLVGVTIVGVAPGCPGDRIPAGASGGPPLFGVGGPGSAHAIAHGARVLLRRSASAIWRARQRRRSGSDASSRTSPARAGGGQQPSPRVTPVELHQAVSATEVKSKDEGGGGTAAAGDSAAGAKGRVIASQVGTESMESDVLDQEASPQEPAVCSGSGLVEAERALGHVFGLLRALPLGSALLGHLRWVRAGAVRPLQRLGGPSRVRGPGLRP